MTQTRILAYFLWIWLAIFTAHFSGCMHVFHKSDAPLPPAASSEAQIAFEEALADYGSGDFEGALARFRVLSSTGASDTIARKAKLGEIYCHMILAKTQADYQVAVDMWRELDRTTKSEEASWAITLTDPLVDRMEPRGAENKMGAVPSPTTTLPEVGKQTDTEQRSKAKIAELTKKANKADQLQRQLHQMIGENKSLKEKIKALEAIDQNIQRKKSEIATTDEQSKDKE